MTELHRANFYLYTYQFNFLRGLEGKSVSEHIRQAIDDYIAKKKPAGATTSLSRGGENGNS